MSQEEKKKTQLETEETEEKKTTGTAEDTKQTPDEVIGKDAADEDAPATDVSDAQQKAEAAVEEMKARYVRLQADFSNFKKRSASEKLQISEVVKMDVLHNILPIVDNFERALQAPQDSLTDELKSFVDGYAMIYKQLMDVLAKEGVTKIEAVGKPFAPNNHQAVMRVPSDEYEDDTVVEVLQEGYLLGDKTLRPAMVKVAFNG